MIPLVVLVPVGGAVVAGVAGVVWYFTRKTGEVRALTAADTREAAEALCERLASVDEGDARGDCRCRGELHSA